MRRGEFLAINPGGQPALLSLFNLQGRFAASEPNVLLRDVPSGSYALSLPAIEASRAFVVNGGAAMAVQLP